MIELDSLHFATELQFIMLTIFGKQQPSVEQFSFQLKVIYFGMLVSHSCFSYDFVFSCYFYVLFGFRMNTFKISCHLSPFLGSCITYLMNLRTVTRRWHGKRKLLNDLFIYLWFV